MVIGETYGKLCFYAFPTIHTDKILTLSYMKTTYEKGKEKSWNLNSSRDRYYSIIEENEKVSGDIGIEDDA